jgi:hypothetical protein
MALVSKTELIKLQKQLVTDGAIGKKLKVTRQRIHQLRNRYGIASSYAGNPERNEEVIVLYKKGLSGTAIVKKFDLSISRIYRVLNDAGVIKGKGNKKPAKKRTKR